MQEADDIISELNRPQPKKADMSKFIAKQLQGTYDDVFIQKSKQPPKEKDISKFISKQLSGTYDDVFGDNKKTTIALSRSDILLTSSIDNLIDETLAIR